MSSRSYFAAALALFFPCWSLAQPQTTSSAGQIDGTVTYADGRPLSGAEVRLEIGGPDEYISSTTDPQGRFRFAPVSRGRYVIHAIKPGWRGTSKGPVELATGQHLVVNLELQPETGDSSEVGDAAEGVKFSDEPTFTVAGVTDPTNLGGHGSDVVLRTKESLARATISLSNANIEDDKRRVEELRKAPDSAELHELLGEIAEVEKRPLDAAREYQRAAEMEPSEPNLFAWGAELLLHRAFDPSSQVFTNAHRRYPKSSRILVGLGVASYAQGRGDQATQQLAAACDLNPQDSTPYLFLGRMQSAEKTEPAGWTERLRRFAELHPENSLAHYYYAVALTKDSNSTEHVAAIESSLQKAVELDPHLGDAYLQLGILYAQRKDFANAISVYQKAIENTSMPDEAHFRLAEAYRLTGQRDRTHEEILQYEQISKQKMQAAERERHEIQQFVYTLRGQTPSTTTPANSPQ